MKVTARWINAFLDRLAAIDEIVAGLTQAGFGCEERIDLPDGEDAALDFEITSNRGDCVSVVGLARELAAATGRRLLLPAPPQVPMGPSVASQARVEIRAADLCPYFSARLIRGVKVGPSPAWLRERLEAVGQRSVNNVVDVTNYVLIELGQPLHAFDLATLNQSMIVVRRGDAGESLVGLDGSKQRHDPSMLVIADSVKAVGLAGMMGGLETEVRERTRDVLLEAAVFDAANIRATSRRLKLASAASYRFERGIHPATVAYASDRAARLIVQVAGGTLQEGAVVAGQPIAEPVSVSMRAERCRAVAGIDIPTARMVEVLGALELKPEVQKGYLNGAGAGAARGEVLRCTVPPHRLDLSREIDLVEEVVRIHGLDRIPAKERLAVNVVPIDPERAKRQRLDEVLTACGFFEVVTFSFLNVADATPFLPPGASLMMLQDERRKGEPALQPSVLPGMLRCRKRNQNAGHKSMRLFQTAACFALASSGEKMERLQLGLVLDAPDRQMGLRVLRGALDEVVQAIHGHATSPAVDPTGTPPWAEQGAGAALTVGSVRLGAVGVLGRSLQAHFDLENPVVAAELDLAALLGFQAIQRSLAEITAYPSIQRDLSLVVDEAVPWAEIEREIGRIDPAGLETLEFVGVYRGKPIEAGKKSVTLRLTFRDPSRTLRHEEVDPAVEAVVAGLGVAVKAGLRE